MKKTIYAILVMAAPLLAQCPNSLLPSGVPCTNPLPTREFGQPTLIKPNPNSSVPNLVTGSELFHPSAIAFDGSVTPPRVYVVDTGNNRVLGWSNAGNVNQGTPPDLVLGQPASPSGGFDFTSTLPWSPGSTNTTGLNTPTGIAVDAAGNVYVADSANNRILRYATPYKQQAGNLLVDLVIGQKGVASGNSANQGQTTPSQSSLNLYVATPYYTLRNQNAFPQDPAPQIITPTGLAIDSQGNLFVTDPGNNRVLMFPKGNLNANTQLPAATVALGQSNFNSNQTSNPGQSSTTTVAVPTGVAVDTQGNVYVTDAYGRALFFPGPVTLGEPAKTVLGIPQTPGQGQSVQYPSQYSLGAASSGGSLTDAPQGLFVLNNPGGTTSLFVCDSPQNRVVRYDSMTVPNNANSPIISAQFGQAAYNLGPPNQGLTAPTNQTFSYPVSGAIRPDNSEMWVVDQSNHRVVAFASQGGGVYNLAFRVLGQKDYNHNGANLVEGREVWFELISNGQILSLGGGMAVDTNSNPPHFYIADTQNNRILGFKDVRSVGVGPTALLAQTADIVIGQTDLTYNLVNSPNNAPQQPTATGLYRPSGLAVDKNGNLWVADTGNGRAVRFPSPFTQTPGTAQTANLVLGQNTLSSFTPSVSQFNMAAPFGLALFSNGDVAVSDIQANRVLVFPSNGGSFTNGEAASYVIGQTGFNTATTGNSSTQLNFPLQLAVDSSDRLYICDYNNARLAIFSKPTASTPRASLELGLPGAPQGIAVSLATGLSWVTISNTVYQLPEFDTLGATFTSSQQLQPLVLANNTSFSNIAVTLDPFDDVIVADAANRVTFFFDQLFYRNTANYTTGLGSVTTAGPVPNMLAELHLLGNGFNFTPSYGSSPANLPLPWSTTYSNGNTNLQVTVAGIPAPIFRVDSPAVGDGGAILIQIPNAAPSSGAADFVISNPTTGQIYAAATLNMQQSSPGIYTLNSSGTAAVAALAYDAKGAYLGINSASVPVTIGGIIDLWLTGAGYVFGLPADGIQPNVSPSTAVNPTVIIGGRVATVLGTAMSSQFPGIWQINAVIPAGTPPSSSAPVSVVVQMNGSNSNYVGTGTGISPGADQNIPASNSLITTIYVK